MFPFLLGAAICFLIMSRDKICLKPVNFSMRTDLLQLINTAVTLGNDELLYGSSATLEQRLEMQKETEIFLQKWTSSE